jgi:predicted SAM-dependent methyltransferase/ADP-heptose:LPS heptosyltransferase
MTWSLENSKNDEASKIRWETIPYFHGRILDIGCGPYKTFPHWTGVDNGHHWGNLGVDVRVDTAEKLDVFGSRSWDGVFSSHLLEHIPYENVPNALKEWVRVVKDGGHLMLYLPDEDEYPKVGHKYANTDHKWDVSYDKLMEAMEKVERGWDLIDFQKRNETDEYSLWFVFRIGGKGHRTSFMSPKPAKRAAIVRYGAQGDMIQMSSILPWLKSEGYWIDLYCQSGDGYEVIKHDPHIDRFIIQGKDEIPNQFLKQFWDYTRPKYDKWINLCESVEGTLLASPGRATFEWTNEARAVHMERNYLEWTHLLAGVPPPYRPAFHSTLDEKSWARRWKERTKARNVILWSLAGSSGHKVWPHLDTIIARVMLEMPDTHVVLVGDASCMILEQGWENEKRVHRQSGKWSIRESMAFAEVADLVIGTETGLLNAAGHMATPKIITLSHSSQEMLTKHWKNVIALEQPAGVGCSKHPCRQLHGGEGHSPWEDCPRHDETGTALCQFHIHPDMMWEAILSVLRTNVPNLGTKAA